MSSVDIDNHILSEEGAAVGASAPSQTPSINPAAALQGNHHVGQEKEERSPPEVTKEDSADVLNNKRSREDEADQEGPDKKRSNGLPSGDLASNDPDNEMNPLTYSEVVEVPASVIGKVIGKGGETIKKLQFSTGASIQVDHSAEGPNKRITVAAPTQEIVEAARLEIMALTASQPVEADQLTERLDCPQHVVGRIIGRGGETIRALQSASGAHITINQNVPEGQPRMIEISGPSEPVQRARLMIEELIRSEPGSAQAIIQRVMTEHGIGKAQSLRAPKSIIGKVIGRGGETIKNIQRISGATVQIDQSTDPCKISIAGQDSTVDEARRMIEDVMSGRDPFAGQQQQQGMMYGGPAYYPPYGGGYPGGYGGGYYGMPAGYSFPQGYGGGYPQQPGMMPDQGPGPIESGATFVSSPIVGGKSGEWQQLKDIEGRPYYYNGETGVTQWEKPQDF